MQTSAVRSPAVAGSAPASSRLFDRDEPRAHTADDSFTRVPSMLSLQVVRDLRAQDNPRPLLQPPVPGLPIHVTCDAPDAIEERYEAVLFQAQQFLHPAAQGRQQLWFADRFDNLCTQQHVSPLEVLEMFRTFQKVHDTSAQQRRACSEHLRTQALTIMLAMYGLDQVRPSEEQIAAARRLNWSRLITFSGEVALLPLANLVLGQSTLVAASQWCALVALRQATEAKVAVTLLGKMKCYGLASAAALGATLTAGGAGALGALALYQAYTAITAFRDVWDNGFSRDAYLFHNVYVRESRLRQDRTLARAMQGWTPPSRRMAHWVGQRWPTAPPLSPLPPLPT